MKSSLWSKVLAIGAVVGLLTLVLTRIGFLVDERRGRQQEAIESVQQSQAGAQSVMGPWLHRACVEEWEVEVGEGKERRLQTERREFRLQQAAQDLKVQSFATAESRYRGLFKVNGFLGRLDLDAQWPSLAALEPQAEKRGSRLSCGPITLMLAVADTRGVQRAELKLNGQPQAVSAGTEHPKYARGLHAPVALATNAGPLQARLSLDLRGTGRLEMVPAAAQTEWDLKSDWPHPSFGGRFLPVQRDVDEQGFHAVWRVSELASSAARDVAQGTAMCTGMPPANAYAEEAGAERDNPNCLDSLAVSFIDPVNPYVLADRAVKYGLLFVALTFVAVALTEVLGRSRVRRVHPVQYALVGLALSLFFMLLLALSEHLLFEIAYAAASAACAGVLGVYGAHMLGGWRAGAAFGGALGGLYGLMYVLLTREQTALVVGTIGLFAAVAAVMLLTRKLDWYRLFDDLSAPRARAE
ncbi:MAG TPA: cell envelope integrity protein CreD [Ideonella sp.]|uniref:cell envelope integrity protein CreD n=1 Tax=Ideonella sp. TaxID=1929293 RepID=UPI002E3489D4|nr:cell envelope integrity protein CreD [Ideonella sp.]HEX5682945.1 cell envelope integrity protein CreD [Ideonella sp.]